MKGLNATSAKATPKAPRHVGQPSASPHSPIVDGFALAGPSNLPDPAFYAYRQDLADTALAGRVIASHYAEPLPRLVKSATKLMPSPNDAGEPLVELAQGDEFDLLDSTRGWAWGYAGGRVGYVRAEAVGAL